MGISCPAGRAFVRLLGLSSPLSLLFPSLWKEISTLAACPGEAALAAQQVFVERGQLSVAVGRRWRHRAPGPEGLHQGAGRGAAGTGTAAWGTSDGGEEQPLTETHT